MDRCRPDQFISQGNILAVSNRKRQSLASDVGVDAVGDRNAGDGRAGLQVFLNNLGFERFGVRATLAHGNPGIKGYRVGLKTRGRHRP